jgi:threonine/homoserine/homoserine lactone efflux protein
MIHETLLSGIGSGPLQFLLAAAVALAAAAPIGPIGIMTIHRAMSLGFRRAFWPTLGAAAANGIFGVIAALGSGYLTGTIMGSRFWLRLIGSVILMIMGIKVFAQSRASRAVSEESFGSLHLGLLNLTLVLSNPLTLAFYLAVFTMLGLKSTRLFTGQTFVLGAGIVFGVLVWFAFICVAAGRFHMKVGDALVNRVRTGVGALLTLIGFVSAVSLLLSL